MNIHKIQTEYDTLLVKISAAIMLIGLFSLRLYSECLALECLQIATALGVCIVLSYLVAVGWFLECCGTGDDINAGRAKIAAKYLQLMLVVMALSVVILVAIIGTQNAI